MAQFSVNPKRFDPYKNFKFPIKWDGRYVAGGSKISGLRRTTKVIEHREGGDPSTSRKSPGRTEYASITLERGVTHDRNSRIGPTKSGVSAPAQAQTCLLKTSAKTLH
jgi:phage tail-like protein